jgi:hypothetical protein
MSLGRDPAQNNSKGVAGKFLKLTFLGQK